MGQPRLASLKLNTAGQILLFEGRQG